jgi:hypothetical protein
MRQLAVLYCVFIELFYFLNDAVRITLHELIVNTKKCKEFSNEKLSQRKLIFIFIYI